MRRTGAKTTAGSWRVAGDLPGEDSQANGLVVVCDGVGLENIVIADCRNDYLPVAQQKANARLCAAAKEAVALLTAAEVYLGDLPSKDRAAGNLHRQIVSLLLDVM
jgi:hypothetical protein